jgi:hypothetical protein
MAKGNNRKQSDGSNLDFEAQPWAAADKMRGHMDTSEYKYICLGLIAVVRDALLPKPLSGGLRVPVITSTP